MKAHNIRRMYWELRETARERRATAIVQRWQMIIFYKIAIIQAALGGLVPRRQAKNCKRLAVDHEAKTLAISRDYARLNGLEGRVTWLKHSLQHNEEREFTLSRVAESPVFSIELLLDGHGMAVLSR